jgi:hypothetical protein
MAISLPYSPPKLCIFQDFEAVLAAGVNPLFPVIVGPSYALHRYSEEDEQEKLGVYDRTIQTDYAWPGHVAGGVIDLVSARIINQDALLNYYTTPAANANLESDDSNRLVMTEIVKTNAAGVRDAAFGTRDVQAGDIVRITGGGGFLIETVVINCAADVIAGTTDPAPSRVVGFGDTTLGDTETIAPPTAYTVTYEATLYDGLADGYPQDTYSIRVLVLGSAGVGLLNGTQLLVTSTGGDTNTITLSDANYDVGDSRYEVPLGTRGAVLNIADAGGGSVNVADTWEVVIAQNYTEIDVTNALEFKATGPYTGALNTQYIITVTAGGTLGTDDVTLTFSTTNGQDTSGTINATAASFTGPSEDFAFGNRGMFLTLFDTLQMNTGDIIVFDVEAASEGEIHTLVLRDAVNTTAVDTLSVEFFVETTFEVSDLFYDLTQDLISVYANMTTTSDLLGTAGQVFDVYDGCLFADYRELRTVGANILGTVEQQSGVDAALGPAVATNPLACGVYEALTISNGVSCYYLAIESDDDDGYIRALEVLTTNEAVYSLVPLTDSEVVKRAFATHVNERSNDCNNMWRITWLANHTLPVSPIYGHEADLLATVADFPPSGARQVVSAGALFATNGVLPGDILRINYDFTDPDNPTYDEYVIDAVNEDDLLLLTPLPAPIAVAIKIEIHRNLTNTEYACELAAYSTSYDDRRVRSVWADGYVDADGNSKDLVYLCAYLAGARAGAAPHAPLSLVTLPGVFIEEQVIFSNDDLDIVAAGGTWIVIKDFNGRVYTRHQLTTRANPADLQQREDSITTNLDHISREFLENTRDLYGQGNVSPEMIALISARIKNISLEISARSYSAIIGPQLLDIEIQKLQVNEVNQDTIDVELIPVLPVPLNTLNIRFIVGG